MRRSYIVSLSIVVAVAAVSLVSVLAAGWAPVLGVQLQGGVEVVIRPTDDVPDEQLDQAIEIIRNRVDALGVAEPDITRQGEQVVIQLPWVKDRQRAVDLVGQTAELRFRPVVGAVPQSDAQAVASLAGVAETLFSEAAAPTTTAAAAPTTVPATDASEPDSTDEAADAEEQPP